MKKISYKCLIIIALVMGEHSTKAQTLNLNNQNNYDTIGISHVIIKDIDTSTGVKLFAINNVNLNLQDSILKVIVSNGYWSWEITANTELNHSNMRRAKLKFKEEYPEIFAKIACDKAEISVIKNEEFLHFGPEIKEYILSHPEQFKVLPKN